MEERGKRYTTKEISELLEIHPNSLRKYSEALEKEGHIFERNSRNHRQYAEHDLAILRKTIQIKVDMELTIKSAVQQVVTGANGMEILPEIIQQDHQLEIENTDFDINHPKEHDFTVSPLQAQLLIQLQDQIEKQNVLLNKVWEDLATTKEQNIKLIEGYSAKQRDPEEEERIQRETEEMNSNIRYIRERMEARQEIAMTTSKKKWQFWKK